MGIEPEVVDPAFVIQDNLGRWRAQDTWPVVTTTQTVRLEPGSYVDDGGRSAAAAGPVDPGAHDMEHGPTLPPQAQGEPGKPPRVTDDANAFYTWSRPVNHDTRITGTPRVSFEAEGTGNVLVRTWDVAPDGTVVMFDLQMSLVQDVTVAFDLDSYLRSYTATMADRLMGTFSLSVNQGRS